VFFFASAQRFLLAVDPTGGVTERHEVSRRLNFKLTWQPNPSNNFTGHLSTTPTTSPAAPACRP
jgi:hypothetical protein